MVGLNGTLITQYQISLLPRWLTDGIALTEGSIYTQYKYSQFHKKFPNTYKVAYHTEMKY